MRRGFAFRRGSDAGRLVVPPRTAHGNAVADSAGRRMQHGLAFRRASDAGSLAMPSGAARRDSVAAAVKRMVVAWHGRGERVRRGFALLWARLPLGGIFAMRGACRAAVRPRPVEVLQCPTR